MLVTGSRCRGPAGRHPWKGTCFEAKARKLCLATGYMLDVVACWGRRARGEEGG